MAFTELNRIDDSLLPLSWTRISAALLFTSCGSLVIAPRKRPSTRSNTDGLVQVLNASIASALIATELPSCFA